MFFQQDFNMSNNNYIDRIDSCFNNLSNIEYNFNTINCLTSLNEDNDYCNNEYNTNNTIKEAKQKFSHHDNNTNRSQVLKGKRDHIKFVLSKKKQERDPSPPIDRYEKNQLLKQKNREASQKSRNKQKEKFLNLMQENVNLRQEIGNFNEKINLLCHHCKDMFNHDGSLIHPSTEDIIPHCQVNTSQLQLQLHNHLSSFISSSSNSFTNLVQSWQTSFYLCLIASLLIICLICTYSTVNMTSIQVSQSNPPTQRQLIDNEDKEYKSIKQMPQILIDDPHSKMSYYVNFEDFYKLKKKNIDICSNPLLENIVNNKNITIEKKKKSFYDSIYFKLFVPLCNENNISSLNYFLNDHLQNHSQEDINKKESHEEDVKNDNEKSKKKNDEDNQTGFYYEVECQVMNFTKMIKKIK